MNARFAPLIVALLGVLCLGLGATLRLRSGDLGAKAASGLNAESMFASMSGEKNGALADTMKLAQRANALYDIALPLLWTGGALLVIAAVAELFLPAWMARRVLSAGNGPRDVGHPVPGNLP